MEQPLAVIGVKRIQKAVPSAGMPSSNRSGPYLRTATSVLYHRQQRMSKPGLRKAAEKMHPGSNFLLSRAQKEARRIHNRRKASEEIITDEGESTFDKELPSSGVYDAERDVIQYPDEDVPHSLGARSWNDLDIEVPG